MVSSKKSQDSNIHSSTLLNVGKMGVHKNRKSCLFSITFSVAIFAAMNSVCLSLIALYFKSQYTYFENNVIKTNRQE